MIPEELPQHHYVVFYDTHAEEWSIDWQTTYDSLQEGQVWVERQWEIPEESTPLGDDYYKKGEELLAHLATLHSKGMVIAPSLGREVGSEPDED